MYALVEDHIIIKVGRPPNWFDAGTGQRLTDEQWKDHGWLPIINGDQGHDPQTEYVVPLPQEEWVVGPDQVVRTWEKRTTPALPIVVYKLDLWERATDAEAEAILAAMQAQPVRIRMIFDAAQTFREDHELWPLLMGAAVQLFGEGRAAQLLAPSA